MMKLFQVNKEIAVVCRSESTRYGFRHLATLMICGDERETVKCCYYNRTWERYCFESVLWRLAEKTKSLNEKDLKRLKEFIKYEK